MNLHEYQGKALLSGFGVRTQRGIVAHTPDEAVEAAKKLAEETGTQWFVIKAQIHAGGRGKGGGVKLAKSLDEVREKASAILGMQLITPQTPPEGKKVHMIYIAEDVYYPGPSETKEYYMSVLLDRQKGQNTVVYSTEGGMDIEQLAVERPDALAKIAVDAVAGIDLAKAREIALAGHFPAELADKVAPVLVKLYEVFVKEDATLVEVNPLVLTTDGHIVALDGKVTLDDNAEFRHERAEMERDDLDPLEAKAKAWDLNYVKLDGQVGIIGNGAGLVMSTLDVVAYAGERHGGVRPANFLDIGGGASAEVMANGLDVILGDAQVKSVFVNVFGGITACDAVANGIVGALEKLGSAATKPLVVRLDGNNVVEGRRILADFAHPLVTVVETMDEAADKAAELANR